MISRILGPEWGGSIGVVFALANAINCSLNVVGFCQNLQAVMGAALAADARIVDGGANDVRITGTITMCFVAALCGVGAKYEAKVRLAR